MLTENFMSKIRKINKHFLCFNFYNNLYVFFVLFATVIFVTISSKKLYKLRINYR